MLGDLGRFFWWSVLRHGIRNQTPERLRALSQVIGTLEPKLRSARGELMADELERCFGARYPSPSQRAALLRKADLLWTRCLVEELTLDAHAPHEIQHWMRFRNRGHLDAALAEGRGVLLLFPHAGNVMMLIALLAHSGYDYAQVAARGFPEDYDAHGPAHRPSRFNRWAQEAREAAEDRLSAEFIPFFRPRQMLRALERNAILGLAFDGRASSHFMATRYLGRPAHLARGPWKLAQRYRVPIVPAVCAASAHGPHELRLFPPVLAEPNEPLEALQQRTTASTVEAFLNANPEHYLRWLTHCRKHAGADPYPLFRDGGPSPSQPLAPST
jgi:Kdo2-lipid IVA lauroyltransferase/acyltransferase